MQTWKTIRVANMFRLRTIVCKFSRKFSSTQISTHNIWAKALKNKDAIKVASTGVAVLGSFILFIADHLFIRDAITSMKGNILTSDIFYQFYFDDNLIYQQLQVR